MLSDALPDDPEILERCCSPCEFRRTAAPDHQGTAAAFVWPQSRNLMLLGLEDVGAKFGRRSGCGRPDDARRAHGAGLTAGASARVVDIDDTACPCCQSELHEIGKHKERAAGHRAAAVPGARHPRPKYACRKLRMAFCRRTCRRA